MNKFKRFGSLLLALVFCLGALAACGNQDDTAPEEDPATQGQDVEDTGNTDTQEPADDANADAEPAEGTDPAAPADGETPAEGDAETPAEGESAT